MRKFSALALALCLSVPAATCMAASDSGGNVGPQRVTGTSSPANGTSPATVGPTGSTQPDATRTLTGLSRQAAVRTDP